MFDVGFWELAVIGVTALVVVGPERLPGLARTAGRYVGDAQRIIQRVRLEFEREMAADEYRQHHAALERRMRELQQPIDIEAGNSIGPPPASATADASTADTPTADTPTADTPTADAPTADAPTADAPTAEAPAHARDTAH